MADLTQVNVESAEDARSCAELDAAFTNLQRSIVETVRSADPVALEVLRTSQQLSMKNSKGFTFLHSLLTLCNREVEKKTFFFILGAAPHLCTEQTKVASATPLSFASKNTLHNDVIRALILANPDTLNMKDIYGMTPLLYVCAEQGYMSKFYNQQAEDYVKLVQFMLENGANANATDKNGLNSAIYLIQSENINREEIFGSISSRLEVIEKLLEILFINGANCNHEILKYVEDLSIAKVILKYYTCDINMIDNNGWTSLHYIIINNLSKSELIEFLIENAGAKVENTFNPTFDLAKKKCKFSITETYLKENPHVISSCGNELLRLHCDNVENIKRLLVLGADPNKLERSNTSPLYEARKNSQVIKLLLENGANPFQGFPQQTSFIYCIFREILEMESEDMKALNEWYYILELILLQMPDISNTNMSPEISSIFNQCYNDIPEYYKKRSLKIKSRLQIICFIFYRINPSISSIITPSNLFCLKNIEFSSALVDPIARVLTVCLAYRPVHQQLFNTEDFITFLLKSCGFTIQTNNCVSVLTVFLMLQQNKKTERDGEKNIVKELINRNINVGSIALQITDACALKNYFTSTFNYNIDDTKYLRMTFKIPDAILISIINNKFYVIELLLAYWYGPPLALIMLQTVRMFATRTPSTSKLELKYFIRLFNILVKYGGVPHGTEMYSRVVNTVQQMINYQNFDTATMQDGNKYTCEIKSITEAMKELTSSPLSLVELCKYVVRERVADSVTYSNKSLPALLHNLLPPLLQNIVIH